MSVHPSNGGSSASVAALATASRSPNGYFLNCCIATQSRQATGGIRQTADLLDTESNQEHPMTMDAKICFDENYKIKAIEPAKFVRAEELEKECGQFVEKISSFSDKVNALVEVLEANAARIDAQKLRAIGLRMAKDNEAEQRSRQQRALQAVINEKRAELDRYTAQFHSLERIENEQKLALEKLTSAQTEVARK
jgi:intraflagellar transport protein 20